MKVLTIVSDLGRGGTQRVAVDVALCYKRNGNDSAVLTQSGSGPRAQDLTEANVTLFLAGAQSSSIDTPANAQARDWQPDIIHFHRNGRYNQAENDLILYLKNGRGSKVKVIEHSHFGRCDRTKDRNLIDAHIQITRWCHWKWKQWSKGLKPQPIGVYIPHMIDATRFARATDDQIQAFRNQHNIPANAFVFGYLAQGHHAKWSSTLFNSFKAIAEEDPNTYLMIAGIEQASKVHFTHFPESIKSRIIELPFIQGDQQLSLTYSAMDSFVLATNIGETFGLVLAEAMCCNTPVVTMANPTRGNGQSEVVGHRRGGLIAANPQSVVKALKLIKDDSNLHKHCAAAGREFVINNYNPELVGSKLIKLLNIVHQSKDRQALSSAIKSESTLISSTTTKQLHDTWGGMIGSFTLKQRIIQRAVLSPHLTSLWYAIKAKNNNK